MVYTEYDGLYTTTVLDIKKGTVRKKSAAYVSYSMVRNLQKVCNFHRQIILSLYRGPCRSILL